MNSNQYTIFRKLLFQLNVVDVYTHQFLQYTSKKIKKGELLLDAGAGNCPYKNYFTHAKYESCDYDKVDKEFVGTQKPLHTFLCSLEDIPKKNDLYDSILCTMTLEHIQNPQKAINECFRILKPGGKLFMTTPYETGIHGAPYHYYNYTNFGLEYLFKDAGFEIQFINPMGGIFSCLARRLRTFTTYIYIQYLYKAKTGVYEGSEYTFEPNYPMAIVLFPFFITYFLFGAILFPLIFINLDFLDKKKAYTLGYMSYCIKPKTGRLRNKRQ